MSEGEGQKPLVEPPEDMPVTSDEIAPGPVVTPPQASLLPEDQPPLTRDTVKKPADEKSARRTSILVAISSVARDFSRA